MTRLVALQLVERGRRTLDTSIGDVDPTLWPGRESVTLLERATGSSVHGLVERRVLRPAGVTRSAFAVRRDRPEADLREHARLPGRTLDLRAFEPSIFCAAGALVSTALTSTGSDARSGWAPTARSRSR